MNAPTSACSGPEPAVSHSHDSRLSGGWLRPLMLGVRLHMPSEPSDSPEPPDRRINWSIYVLVGATTCLVTGGAAPALHLPGRGSLWFGLAVFLGAVIGFVVNRLRPRYDKTVGRWRSFYDFLLRQMPPPD